MSISRQFSTGVAWMAVGVWIEQALNFVIMAILARMLSAEAFGLLAMAAAFIILAEFLVRESLSEFLIAVPSPTVGHFNAAFWLLCGLGLILTLAIGLVSIPIAGFFGEPDVMGLMLALSPTVLMIALTAVPAAILRRDLQFRVLSLRAIFGMVAGGVVGIGMVWAGFGVWALAGQRLALIGVNSAMAWFAVDWRPTWSAERAEIRDVFQFGSQMIGLRTAELASTQTPAIIIGATLGPAALGLYSIASRLIEIASFLIITPLRSASQPAFASMERAGDRAADLLRDIDRMAGMIAFPAFAGLAMLAAPVLQLTFGAQWVPAAAVLAILTVNGVYLCMMRVHVSFCLAMGSALPVTVIAWAEVGLSALMIWLAAPYGLEAIALAYAASFLLLWPFRLAEVARLAQATILSLVVVHIRPLMATGVMALVVWAVAQALAGYSPAIVVGVGTLAGVAAFTLLALVFLRDRLALLQTYVLVRGAP